MKKKIIRTCVFTKMKNEKKNLLRLCKDENGIYFLDLEQKIQSRAIYFSKTKETLNLIRKYKKYTINLSDIEKIEKIIKEEGVLFG